MIIAITAFTDKGRELLNKVTSALDETFRVYNKAEDQLKPWVERQFAQCDALVFIGAAGIALRLVAGHIAAKDKDPAVIVIDEQGRFVIPVLSGHIGGANALAVRLADMLKATPVITTATDINGVFAVDVWSSLNDCVINDRSTIKDVSASLLRGEHVGFHSDFQVEGSMPEGLRAADSGRVGVCVSLDGSLKPFDVTCCVIPRIVSLGVGCRRDTDYGVFEPFVLETLEQNRLSLKAIRGIASIDLKADEPCILRFAREHDIPFATYSGEELCRAVGEFSPSAFVKATTGVDNVCERSAALHSGGGTLIIKKTIGAGATLAAAVSQWRAAF